MNKAPIYYFTRILPHYRRPILEKLNQRLNNRLIVCHGQPVSGSSFESITKKTDSGFTEVHLKNYWIAGEKIHLQPFRKVFKKYGKPAVVLAEESPRSVSLPFLIKYAKKLGARTLLWGHYSSNNRPFDPENNRMDKYRLHLAKSVDGCVCYTNGIADLLRPYIPEERLFVANNTIELQPYFDLYDQLKAEGRDEVRRRLGLSTEKPVLAFIGRLTESKRVDLVLETAKMMDATAVIIGSGPAEKSLSIQAKNGEVDCVFTGALTEPEDIAPWLFSADALLNPGYLGLSVNQAMALGLPVVSVAPKNREGRFHSPEAEFVKQKETGLFVRHADAKHFAEAVADLIKNWDDYSKRSHQFAQEKLSTDYMIQGLYVGITQQNEEEIC